MMYRFDRREPPEIIERIICSMAPKYMLTPYGLGIGPGPALLASYLLQPAATPVTWYGKSGRNGHAYRHRWR